MVSIYRAYGLTIASDLILPELEELANPALFPIDVTIRLTPVQGAMPDSSDTRIVEFLDGCTYFAWQGLGRICVRAHRHVDVDPVAGLDPAVLSLALLGPVLAEILHGRGHLILHGSSIALNAHHAIAFVGDNGAGKSTLAGAFIKAGYALVNDDIISMPMPSGSHAGPTVLTGFPSIKLARSAIGMLAPLPGQLLPAVPPHAEKVRLRLPSTDVHARDLVHLFVLKRGEAFSVESLDPPDRLAALMRYSYMPKFGVDALKGARASAHFMACATLIGPLPVAVLTVPASLDDLIAMPAAIAAFIANANGDAVVRNSAA